MKLITTATELENEFRRLTNQYDNFYWATAWASSGSKLFNDLMANKHKIKKIVVGIHFYQTHPDFIEAFLNDDYVRFIQQPEGTFHPKLYLFSNNIDKWELIIGSANFTLEAFSRNTEASILISNNDDNALDTYQNAMTLVEQTFTEGKTFQKEDLEQYRTFWHYQRQKIKSLSGQYGSKDRKPKPVHEVKIMARSWDDFVKKVRNDPTHGLNHRLRVIDIAKELFASVKHFSDLTADQRKFIAGIPNNLNTKGAENWAFFGNMKGSGVFANRINKNDINISNALDYIPNEGNITKGQYDNFITEFKKAFIGTRLENARNLAATRLLCMKRPDTFVCYSGGNRSALCKDFGIIQFQMDYERYWDDIIERIYDSIWWQNPNPKNNTEIKVCNASAALLDSLYYE